MARDMDLLEPGTQLDGRYEVLQLLGQGGMAAVYKVRHMGLHSVHALKVLNADLARDEELRARFLTEGRIQARIRHPHIVKVTEIVTTPVAGLVMDFVEGPTLGDFCRSGPRPGLELTSLLQVFLPVLEAMEEAHRQGVVHRDLKPDNVLIGRDGKGQPVPMVTDFGIAKVLEGSPTPGKGRTRAGMRMGTLLYMSPEQIRGASEVDVRSDVFSLGAILYEAATGVVAFDAASDFDTMKKIVEGTYEPPERVVGQLPPVVAGCIRKALAVEPEERFQSCGEFHAALVRALEPDAPVPEKPLRSYAVTGIGPIPSAPAARASASAKVSPAKVSEDLAAAKVSEDLEAPLAPTYVPTPASAPQAARPPVALPEPPRRPALPMPSAPPVQQRAPVAPPMQQRAPVAPPMVPLSMSAQARGYLTPNPGVSPGNALLLALFCPSGLGQLYNGQVGKGLFFMVVNLVMPVFLANASEDVAVSMWGFTHLLLAADAYVVATKRRVGRKVDSWDFF